MGARNPWKLPREAVLARLRQRGISVYRTDRDGAVTLRLHDRVRVRAVLEIESLPTPLRLAAYFNPAWRLSSDWLSWPLQR